MTISLTALSKHAASPFSKGYPRSIRVFYAPVDDLHSVLADALAGATESIYLAMYALTDRSLLAILQQQASSGILKLGALDYSQYYTQNEQALAPYPSPLSVGNSEKNSIMHLKDVVIDGRFYLTGSTNFSTDGQTRQDNALTVIDSVPVAEAAIARITAINQHQLAHPVAPPSKIAMHVGMHPSSTVPEDAEPE